MPTTPNARTTRPLPAARRGADLPHSLLTWGARLGRSLQLVGLALLVLALLGALAGCGGGEDPEDPRAHCQDGTLPIPAECFISGGPEARQ